MISVQEWKLKSKISDCMSCFIGVFVFLINTSFSVWKIF